MHVPYQGGAPLVTAMMGGQLSSAFMDAGSSKQHLPKFKLLGVTGSERLTWLPQVPTLKEQGLQSYEPMGWFALLLPAATPKAVIDKFSAESQRILKLPEVREKILSEAGPRPARLLRLLFIEGKAMMSTIADYDRVFTLGNPPEYEPGPERSMSAIGARAGMSAEAAAYDHLLSDEGKAFLYAPLFNYAAGHYDDARTMMLHPNTVLGISDGGAHCGMICDASAPTYLLAHFVRDRSRGPRIGLEHAVHLQTRRTAELYGLRDRGLIAPGLRADLNLIDFNALALPLPAMVYDLPANGQRLIQRAHGYHSTVLRGQITFEDGVATGALPGQLVRGQQRAR
jgi:N-acyl-D-aspartate/D-glutamate deacylase